MGSKSDRKARKSPYARIKGRVFEDERARNVWKEIKKLVKLSSMNTEWLDAIEETETAWHALMANPLDRALRGEYFEKQHLSRQAGLSILEHKRESGV